LKFSKPVLFVASVGAQLVGGVLEGWSAGRALWTVMGVSGESLIARAVSEMQMLQGVASFEPVADQKLEI
jgi:hypothetical protein